MSEQATKCPLCLKKERERFSVDSCPICHARHEWRLKDDLVQAEQIRDTLAEALRREREAANRLVDAAQSAIDGAMFNQASVAAQQGLVRFNKAWDALSVLREDATLPDPAQAGRTEEEQSDQTD